MRDPLTGARRVADWPSVLVLATRSGPAWAALAGVDRMKRFNAHNGHDRGDEILRSLGRHLLEYGDAVAVVRVAGDELALVWPGGAHPAPIATCEHIVSWAKRELTPPQRANCGDPHCLGPSTLAISVGLARIGPGASPARTLQRLRDALHAAKAAGGGRVVLAEDADG